MQIVSFFQKAGFDISCKLSPETPYPIEKNKNISSTCRLLNLLRLIKVNACNKSLIIYQLIPSEKRDEKTEDVRYDKDEYQE